MIRMRIFFPALLLLMASSWTASAQLARNVRLICNWNDTTHAPVNALSQHFNDVWAFYHNGKEYAVIGSTSGAHIIDLDNCKEVAFAAGRSSHVIHRDYKTFQHYLYAVADEGISSLQIFDFSYLPDSLHLVYESEPEEFCRAHNIFIDTNTAKLYCATTTTSEAIRDYLRIYSLQRPDSPRLIDVYNSGDNVHDVYVRNDTAYCSSSFYGYVVLDCTHPPAHPVIGGLLHYPNQGYNHSSWINREGIGVMADETHGSPLKVIDTRELPNIRVLSNFSPRPGDSTCIPHNPFVIGHFAFIAYYFDGLQIWDLTNPAAPVQAGFYDTYPGVSEHGFAGAWGCYPFLRSGRILISDMQTGLYVLDADEALGIQKEVPFSLYPNPVLGPELFFQLPAARSGQVEWALMDMLGKVLQRGQSALQDGVNPPIAVPLAAYWPHGVYVLRAVSGGQVFTARFIKN